jgi:hypothetical protein
MSRLSPQARRLIELARYEDEPGSEPQKRIERSLARRVALGVGAVAAGAAVTKSAAGAGLALGVFKPAVIVGVTAAVVSAGWFAAKPEALSAPPGATPSMTHNPRSVRTAPALAGTTPAPAHSVGATSTAPEPRDVRGPKAQRAANVRPESEQLAGSGAVPHAADPDQLLAETTGLRELQRALRSGDAHGALALLDREDQQHRAGVLQEERAAARVLALCQLGEVALAHAEAARFERRWPRSALLARVRSACR